MTETTFPNSLRARPDTIELAAAGVDTITIRVEMPEVWDVVRLDVSPTASVLDVKRAALAALYPDAGNHEQFVVKHRGWEVLHEGTALADNEIVDGSILLVTHRRRRPVR